jgi:hypothetical protein
MKRCFFDRIAVFFDCSGAAPRYFLIVAVPRRYNESSGKTPHVPELPGLYYN